MKTSHLANSPRLFDARRYIRGHKAQTGESLSFTAFLIVCLTRAVDSNKSLHAYRNWRNQLVIFDDVDVAVMIEVALQDRKFPLLHVIRAANQKTLMEIHEEIRAIQADPSRSLNLNSQTQRRVRWFLLLPGFTRHLIYRAVMMNPHWFKQVAGTVAVTSVGMFGSGGGWGLGIPNHSLSLTVGGIEEKPGVVEGRIEIREYVDLTVSFDHVIVNRAPAARFIQQFKDLMEPWIWSRRRGMNKSITVPISKINGYDPHTGEWNDSLTGDYLWSSVNTREAVPDVMTPYTWSAIRTSFDQMTMIPNYPPVGNICGRAYNNASVGATAFRALGLKTFDAASVELYGIDPNSVGEWNVPHIPLGFGDRFLVFRNAFKIMNTVRTTLKTLEARIAANPTWCEMARRSLRAMDRTKLVTWAGNILYPKMMESLWWMVSPAMSQSGVVSKLRRDLGKRVDAEDVVALLSNVSEEKICSRVLVPSLGLIEPDAD